MPNDNEKKGWSIYEINPSADLTDPTLITGTLDRDSHQPVEKPKKSISERLRDKIRAGVFGQLSANLRFRKYSELMTAFENSEEISIHGQEFLVRLLNDYPDKPEVKDFFIRCIERVHDKRKNILSKHKNSIHTLLIELELAQLERLPSIYTSDDIFELVRENRMNEDINGIARFLAVWIPVLNFFDMETDDYLSFDRNQSFNKKYEDTIKKEDTTPPLNGSIEKQLDLMEEVDAFCTTINEIKEDRHTTGQYNLESDTGEINPDHVTLPKGWSIDQLEEYEERYAIWISLIDKWKSISNDVYILSGSRGKLRSDYKFNYLLTEALANITAAKGFMDVVSYQQFERLAESISNMPILNLDCIDHYIEHKDPDVFKIGGLDSMKDISEKSEQDNLSFGATPYIPDTLIMTEERKQQIMSEDIDREWDAMARRMNTDVDKVNEITETEAAEKINDTIILFKSKTA